MKALILANGKPPRKSEIVWLMKNGYGYLIAADGGANSARKFGFVPDLIIGDLDSISDETYSFYETKTIIKKIKRQNDTDVEKAIKFCIGEKFKDVILLGASGDRLDHTLCNIGNLLKYADKIKLGMLHEKTFARVYEKVAELESVPGETISIYSFSEKNLITTYGLKYKLKNEPLPFGVRSSTSNEAVNNKIKITASSGKFILIREFNVIKRNGFIHNV